MYIHMYVYKQKGPPMSYIYLMVCLVLLKALFEMLCESILQYNSTPWTTYSAIWLVVGILLELQWMGHRRLYGFNQQLIRLADVNLFQQAPGNIPSPLFPVHQLPSLYKYYKPRIIISHSL